jgi:hypothetical protein
MDTTKASAAVPPDVLKVYDLPNQTQLVLGYAPFSKLSQS